MPSQRAFRAWRKIVYSAGPGETGNKQSIFQGENMVLETGVAVSKQKLSYLKVRLLALKEHL